MREDRGAGKPATLVQHLCGPVPIEAARRGPRDGACEAVVSSAFTDVTGEDCQTKVIPHPHCEHRQIPEPFQSPLYSVSADWRCGAHG
jgi:hypothetical protein